MKTYKKRGRKPGSKNKIKTAVVPEKKTRRRQSGVRAKVLALLAASPQTSASLVAKGGFSAASLYLNLKALKKDGMIQTSRNGRVVTISLKKGGAPAKEAASSTEAMHASEAPGALVPTYVPRSLHEALEGLARKLSPVDRAAEKLQVLDQLARSLPGPVASVLHEIIEDLVRYSTDHAA